jgi:MFS superfamily sulfate permease-like transporter
LRGDIVAVRAVLRPDSLAYATIAGVSPVVGLHAAVPALVLYAILGGCRHLIVGRMSAKRWHSLVAVLLATIAVVGSISTTTA